MSIDALIFHGRQQNPSLFPGGIVYCSLVELQACLKMTQVVRRLVGFTLIKLVVPST